MSPPPGSRVSCENAIRPPAAIPTPPRVTAFHVPNADRPTRVRCAGGAILLPSRGARGQRRLTAPDPPPAACGIPAPTGDRAGTPARAPCAPRTPRRARGRSRQVGSSVVVWRASRFPCSRRHSARPCGPQTKKPRLAGLRCKSSRRGGREDAGTTTAGTRLPVKRWNPNVVRYLAQGRRRCPSRRGRRESRRRDREHQTG